MNIKKHPMLNGTLQVNFYKEKDGYIAKCEPLNLVTQGDTLEEAASMFEEAIGILIEDLMESNNLENYLLSLGWDSKKDMLEPPQLEASRFINLNNLSNIVSA